MKNNDLEFYDAIPVSFKVIGTGTDATDIIDKVKSFGYDCVGCFTSTSPSECIPVDEDCMAIIVARDNEELANAIAKTYHDAGVLTIGLVNNADNSCYDSIATDTNFENSPEIIKHLLQPIVSHGPINYDFCDMSTTMRNSRFFKILVAEGKSVEDAVNNMKERMANVAVKDIETISLHLFLSHDRQPAVKIADISHLTEMISALPESIDVIWSMSYDDTLPNDLIQITILMCGKEL